MSEPSLDASSESAPPHPRSDRWIGLLIVAIAFVLSLGLSFWAKNASRPESSAPPGPPRTDGIAGFPAMVDPVTTLRVARTMTRRSLLRGFVADGVRSDGTVDLSEGPGQVRYAFQSARGERAPLPQDPSAAPHCGKQNVKLRHEGLVAEPDLQNYPCATPHVDALPEPHCDFRGVWSHALAKGAPREQLARVEYYRAAAGPAWRFELPGGGHKFSLYGDCGRELTEAEAIGFVP
jgi:hypothetical protein